MKNMFFLLKKKITKKLKEFKLNYKEVRFYKGNEAVVFIDLNERTKVRTYLNLFFRIHESYKAPIVIKFSLFRYLLLTKWFKEVDYIYFSHPFRKYKKIALFSHQSKATFQVDFNYKKVYQTDFYLNNVLPYIMHPMNYLIPTPECLSKQIGILMSGNFEEKIYNTPLINENFKLLNRWQIYNKVKEHVSFIKISGSELKANIKTNRYCHNFVLMKWQDEAIGTEEWRHYLSASKFLFCAPGMTMPMCHNVLEAMSVGVVPILNYENWLNPSLINNTNCLTYKTEEEIDNCINKALAMNDATYQQLRENTINYYTTYYQKYDFDLNTSGTLTLLNENINDLV